MTRALGPILKTVLFTIFVPGTSVDSQTQSLTLLHSLTSRRRDQTFP